MNTVSLCLLLVLQLSCVVDISLSMFIKREESQDAPAAAYPYFGQGLIEENKREAANILAEALAPYYGQIDGLDNDIMADKRSQDNADLDLMSERRKRYFCRKFFVYNPVRGRCQPTPQAFRKGKNSR